MKSNPVLVTVLAAQLVFILIILGIIKFIDVHDQRINCLEHQHIDHGILAGKGCLDHF